MQITSCQRHIQWLWNMNIHKKRSNYLHTYKTANACMRPITSGIVPTNLFPCNDLHTNHMITKIPMEDIQINEHIFALHEKNKNVTRIDDTVK